MFKRGLGLSLKTKFTMLVVLAFIILMFILGIMNDVDRIFNLYNSVSTKTTDSKATFDKRLHFVTQNEDGTYKITLGFQSETEYEAAQQRFADVLDDGHENNGDPNSTPPPSDYTGDLTLPNSNAEAIASRLEGLGYNNYAIAAAIGNFCAESGCDPTVTQGHTHDGYTNQQCVSRGCVATDSGGNAHGFAQWDYGRRQNLINGAMSSSREWTELNYQIEFFLLELNSNHCGVAEFNAEATSVEEAVFWFAKKFERPGISVNCPGYDPPRSQGGNGTKYCASQVSYDERSYINGWNHRLASAQSLFQ